MRFKLGNYKKVYFFDFDDNIISLLDANIYYYEVVDGELKNRQVNTRNFASFFTDNYINGELGLLETYEELMKKKEDKTINEKKYYIINELSYKDFRKDELFIKQVEKTCNLDSESFINRLNLSFPSFLEAYFNTDNFLYIVTARGQNNNTIYNGIKKIIKRFIEITITQYNGVYKFKNNKVFNIDDFVNYLNRLGFNVSYNNILSELDKVIAYFNISDNVIPATNSKTLKRFGIKQSAKPEKGKIIKKLLLDQLSVSKDENWLIGFSDDMAENIEKVEKDVKDYLKKIAKEYKKNISLYLFYVGKTEEHIKVYHY